MTKLLSDTSSVKMKIGKKLKTMRIAAGHTSYEAFSFENKIPRVQYWRMEKGNNFQFESLLRLLFIHKITPEEFFKGIK